MVPFWMLYENKLSIAIFAVVPLPPPPPDSSTSSSQAIFAYFVFVNRIFRKLTSFSEKKISTELTSWPQFSESSSFWEISPRTEYFRSVQSALARSELWFPRKNPPAKRARNWKNRRKQNACGNREKKNAGKTEKSPKREANKRHSTNGIQQTANPIETRTNGRTNRYFWNFER